MKDTTSIALSFEERELLLTILRAVRDGSSYVNGLSYEDNRELRKAIPRSADRHRVDEMIRKLLAP